MAAADTLTIKRPSRTSAPQRLCRARAHPRRLIGHQPVQFGHGASAFGSDWSKCAACVLREAKTETTIGRKMRIVRCHEIRLFSSWVMSVAAHIFLSRIDISKLFLFLRSADAGTWPSLYSPTARCWSRFRSCPRRESLQKAWLPASGLLSTTVVLGPC